LVPLVPPVPLGNRRNLFPCFGSLGAFSSSIHNRLK
jgi:hypothetical protein